MTYDEMAELLQKVQSYDNRTVDRQLILVWLEAAHAAGWTTKSAHGALRNHIANNTAYLVPAHITQGIREWKRQPAPANEILAALPGPPPATVEARRQAIANFAASIRTPR